MNQIRLYQDRLLKDGAYQASLGHRLIVMQSATGSGKSVIFATLVARYLSKNKRKVLIACHREKLVKQSRKVLYDWYNIIAQPVFADTKHLQDVEVYTGMAETLHRRFAKRPNYISNIGLLIVDECHLGLFNKLFAHHPETLIIGFTATPLAASKKNPLKNTYSTIVCGPQIRELIAEKALCPNITYRVKNINRKELKIDKRKGEFDETFMGNVMSTGRHVQNTIEGYQRFCLGKKTIIFNCNVAHSKLVNQAFNDAGYPALHLDGYMSQKEYDQVLEWFENTPGAILNNVAVATTGFDIPSIEAVVINKGTKSLPLFLQMCGRGSRPAPGKDHFVILDMASNTMELGDWSDDRDWKSIFEDPDKPSEGGVAPVKECAGCMALIHASCRTCPYCGADNSTTPVYDTVTLEFEMLIKSKPLDIDITSVIVANGTRNQFASLHEVKNKVIAQAKNTWKIKEMDSVKAYKLLELYQEKVQEWCKAKGKKYDDWYKQIPSKWFFDEMKRVYNWEPEKLSIAI